MADRDSILNSIQAKPSQTQPKKKEEEQDIFLKALRERQSAVPVLNEAVPEDVPVTPADTVAITNVPEVTESKDETLIREYLLTEDPYYDEETLRSFTPQQLTDYIYEEEPALVEKHFPEMFGQLSAEEVAAISDGAELRPYVPTARENTETAIANALLEYGGVDSKYTARSLAKGIVGDPTADNVLATLGLADLTPAGAAFAIQEASREIDRLAETDADAVDYIVPVLDVSLSALEAFPVTKALVKGVKGITKGTKGKKAISDKERARLEKVRDKYFDRKMRIGKAKSATAEEIARKAEEAKKAAAANRDIAEDLILQFEERTGQTISSKGKDGRLTIDPDLARKAGKDTLEQISEDTRSTVRKYLGSDVEMTDAAVLAGVGEEITQPILKPEKFDALVAVVADLKADSRFADVFDNNKTVIDNLFELTVNEELLAGDELLDVLNKYGLSFEDYILTVVGSGSEAGRVLQKLSQIKRVKPANAQIAAQEKATKDAQGSIRKFVMRVENIRRGALVSQVATAARNLTSGAIRAPLEGLGNVMDTALYNLSEEGVGAAAKSIVSRAQWADSFRHMKYMFGPETRLDTQDYVEFILEQPELADQFDLMFNNINEIQKMTGRGEGGVVDATLSLLEDGVDVLNTPNRWQEYLIRRGAFLGELERLTKREYGIDLIDTINDGKIRDLLNDASTVRPAEARSFHDLVADATNRALDITYAKQPDIPVFRSTSQFIVRNGLTTVLPFPRFMFNSMELMGQYAGGASIPLLKRIKTIVTKGEIEAYTAKDRQRIARNIQGIAVAGAAYQYRTSENAPSDYKLLRTSDDTVMDVTPQYPMRQFMYIGEATKRLVEGTFSDWFKANEFVETFVGTNIRQGVGQSLIQEVADLATGVDLTDDEQSGRLLGRALGNYLSTWAVPFAQIIEAERATGQRGLQYKDTGEDPTLDFQTSFMQNLQRPFARFMSAEEEAALPKRETLFAEDKQRVMPLLRVIGGINLATIDDEYGEYIGRFGYTDYELGSKSKVPSIRRFENKTVRDALPIIVESAQRYEERLRKRYRVSSEEVRNLYTEEQFVSSRVRKFIKDKVTGIRAKIGKAKVFSVEKPVYAQSMLDYRRLSKETRVAAGVRFVEEYNREPDPLNEKDLKRLVLIGKAYDKAMK